jgi:hypothetical protein
MIKNSYREEDSSKEKKLIPVLIDLLEKNIEEVSIKMTDSKEDQLKGSDFKMKSFELFKDQEYHVLDAKAATDYLAIEGESEGLPTFAMELASTQKGKYVSGWAVRNNDSGYFSQTEYFLFQWVFIKDKKKGITVENISSIEIRIIPKTKLVDFIERVRDNARLEINGYIGDLSSQRIQKMYSFLKDKYDELKSNNSPDEFYQLGPTENYFELKKARIYLSVCNAKIKNSRARGPKIVFTSNDIKKEQPLNMVISKKYLNEMSVYTNKLYLDK